MHRLGRILSIARYPVESMGGESVAAARLSPYGLEGDRLFAFESSHAPSGMYRLRSDERRAMLQYQATYTATGEVAVHTSTGSVLPLHGDELAAQLAPGDEPFKLISSSRPQTDVRPLSLLARQTVDRLSLEFGAPLDPRRFRANLLLDLPAACWLEDQPAGTHLKVGSATLEILERIPRCRFILYDPEKPLAAEPLFSLMRLLDRRHQGRVGRYARVVVPGLVSVNDPVVLPAENA